MREGLGRAVRPKGRHAAELAAEAKAFAARRGCRSPDAWPICRFEEAGYSVEHPATWRAAVARAELEWTVPELTGALDSDSQTDYPKATRRSGARVWFRR